MCSRRGNMPPRSVPPFRVALLAVSLLVPLPARSDESAPHFAADRPVDMKHIRLDMRIDLKAKSAQSRATLDMAALRDVRHIALDAVDFKVQSVRIQQQGGEAIPCDFDHDGEKLVLNLPEPLPAGAELTALIDYAVTDPDAGLHFFAPSDDEPDAPYVVWSQGQAITNRYWVPCFDHPNEMQTTEIIATADAPNIVISNGRLVSKKPNPDGTTTYHWSQEQPHVVYLMTLVVGQFVSQTEHWRGRPVTYHVPEVHKDKIKNSFASTTRMMEFFSRKIGVEYPWDKYDQVCCYNFGGGMENTSATTLTEGTLHDDRAHLDQDSEGLVAHELAHQWWGDLVTCREWAHIWLNEGFATYFEALWAEHSQGPDEFAVNLHRKARGAIEGGRDKPIVWQNYTDPDQQFDGRAYPKGAWVLHMIRRRLGDDLFWKVINTYCTRHRHQNVETIDLRRAIEDVTGRSFGRFFHDWTERPGAPEVTVEYKWQPDDMLAALDVRQTQKEDAFAFPLTFEFRFESDDLPHVFTADITDKREKFYVSLKRRPSMVRVDPNQAVLMTLREKKSRDLWIAQLEADPNPVRRIQAAEHFGESPDAGHTDLLAKRLAMEPFWAVQEAIAAALGASDSPAARDALLKGLTLENPRARRKVVETLGGFRDEPEVEKALFALVRKGDPSYRVEAEAIRAWADVCAGNPTDELTKLLSRDSDQEIIRSAVLESLGAHGGKAVLDTLLDWMKPGRPIACRAAAVTAAASLLESGELGDTARERTTDAIAACLRKTTRRLQGAALRALEQLGPDAKDALPEIDRLARTGQLRTRAAARRAAETIRSASPAARQPDEIAKRLSKLERENESLRERIEELEAKGKAAAGTAAAQ
ncbi:MAG: hypothetical protein DCC65_01255 [Planctomycetota bacterium]|nr:MAG: hypothetical protein DCC65_01255 [Planctomycetota bacterium]